MNAQSISRRLTTLFPPLDATDARIALSIYRLLVGDAPINPGNSGGALIDLHGQLAGINTAILSPAGGNVGIGFAIPSNTVKHIVNQIIQFGNVKRGKLGIIIQNVNDKYAHILKLKQPQGALIVEVEPNSVAKKNGLKQADVIVKVNNKPIKNVTTLRNTIGLERLGNKIKITVIRNGKEKELNLVLTEIKADIVTFGKLFPPLSGATFANLNKSTLSVHSGVVVKSIQPMSYAWRVGLRKGDIINAVNMRKVTNTFNFRQLVRMYSRGDILLHIIRDQSSFYLVLRKVT